MEFGPQPDDFRRKGRGILGELPEHVTDIRIDRVSSARL